MYWVSVTTQLDINKYETNKLFKQSLTDALAYIEEIKNQDNMKVLKVEITYVESGE